MPLSDLSNSAQDYLKAIWSAQEWSSEPVTTRWIAERIGVRASTVSDTIKRLSEQGLVEHAPYGSIELTESGRAHAVEMVRRHRLIETFLVEVLDYGWDEVHDESESLEHAVSATMIARMDVYLGHPTRDPHGDPIPTADGKAHRPQAAQLTAAPADATLTVARVSDADPGMLRYFAEKSLVPGAQITIVNREPFADALTVRVDESSDTFVLGTLASDAIWVTTER
jgi:DtxR family Mn-dependent transcriptional regulator